MQFERGGHVTKREAAAMALLVVSGACNDRGRAPKHPRANQRRL